MGRRIESGAATKSRTRDLLITNQLLYQLSYSGTRSGLYAKPWPRSRLERKSFRALAHQPLDASFIGTVTNPANRINV